MKDLKRILLVMLAAVLVAVCTYGQKNGNDNRPPKEQPKIIEKPKPPPSNSNSNRKKP